MFSENKAVMLIIDAGSGAILDASLGACQYYGYSLSDLTVMNISDLNILPRPKISEKLQRATEGKQDRFIFQHRLASGEIRDVEVFSNLIPVVGRQLLYSVIHDITDRVKAENALHKSERNLAEAQRLAHLGSWELDLVRNRLDWSDEVYRIFEIAPEAFIDTYEAFIEGIHPDDRDRVNQAYQNSIRVHVPYDVEHRLLMRDGRIKYVHERCTTHFDEAGNPLRSLGTILDITERKVAELCLIDSNVRFRSLFDLSPDPAWIIRNNRFVACNQAAVAVLGYADKETLLGTHPSQLSPPTQPDGEDSFKKAERMMQLAREHITHRFEWMHIRKNGSEFCAEVTLTSIELDDDPFIYCTWRDISEQKRAEQQLRNSESRFRALFESSRDGIFLQDGTTFVECNPAVLEILGATHKDQVVGHTTLEFSVPDPDDPRPIEVRAMEKMQAALEGKPQFFQWPARKLDGSVLYLELILSRVEIGGKSLLQSVARDITARKAADEALRRIQKYLDEAQKIAHLGNWWLNTTTGELHWSDEIYRIFGRTPREFEPSYERFFEAVHPDDVEMIKASEAKAFANKAPHSIDHRIVLLDGTVRWVHEEAVPTHGENGDLLFLSGTVQDITERKQTEEELIRHREHLEDLVNDQVKDLKVLKKDEEASRQMLQLVLDTIPVRVFWKDKDLHYIGCNKLFAMDSGYLDSHELVGRTDYEMGWRDQAELYREDDFGVITSGEPKIAYEEPQTTPDGHTIWLQTSKIPLRDTTGNIIGVLGTYDDITIRKQAEEQLKLAKDEAQKASEAKSVFLANMSHEIRTPLNAVLGLSRIGERGLPGEKGREMFERISKSGQHLLGVINDILDFSKIEAGMLTIESEPFQLMATLEDSIGLVVDRAKTKGLSLKFGFSDDLPAWVDGSPMHLQQILINLLSNAIKFTEQGEVALSVSRNVNIIQFRVSDTGIGITQEEIARLFIPFEQADSSTTRKYGGSGLGLAISQNLAKLMGGVIEVESQAGRGSTFTLNLPLSESRPLSEKEKANPKTEEKQLQGVRILAAEDVEMNRLILEDLLEQEGARVVFCEDGRQAIARLDGAGAKHFDIVLMDVQMPIMDGYEATHRILQIAPDLPIIGLTAHALEEERAKCLSIGMVDHVTKPIDPDILIAAILRHVHNQSFTVYERA